jgi:endonuclease/exonuclease/phosphatase (EEP) superfamily protein YafD
VTGPSPAPPREALPPSLARLGARHPLVIAAVIVTVVITLVTALLTLAGFLADRWWVFDILTSFRPQAVGILAAAAIGLALLRYPRMLVVAVVALAINLGQVAPVYLRHQPAVAADSATLTIAHINLQSSMGDVSAILDWVAGHPADVVVILETNSVLINSAVRGIGDYRMVYPHVLDNGPGDSGRPTIQLDPANSEVVVLAARGDITAAKPDQPGLPQSAVEVHASIGGRPVALLGLHTESPTTAARHTLRDRQLDAVAAWLQTAPDPAIAFGDFNVTYYSPVFRRLLERSATRSSQLGFGVQATWPVGVRAAGIAIDQSVYKGALTAVGRRRGPSLGSEHRVLIVTYALAG